MKYILLKNLLGKVYIIMIRINNIKIYDDISEENLFNFILKKYRINSNDILSWNIAKKSVDARKKDDVHYSYSIDLKLKNENHYLKNKNIIKIDEVSFPSINIKRNSTLPPVIIGAGPAGLFAALTFIQNGYKPVIIEQGGYC